jgi:23S rRNA pseudouridine1911/1915/1917 synthase
MFINIPVLYEDEQYVVFNKPSGLLVIPSPNDNRRTLQSIVNDQTQGASHMRLHPCHRLDRETSGAIIFAKGKRNQQQMREIFHHTQIKKIYLTFVRGLFPEKKGEISKPVRDVHQLKFFRRGQSKPATTRYHRLIAHKDFSVLQVEPVTGRTHQIRIHLSGFGYPLLGERVYAYRRDFSHDFHRLALHALRLTWRHPISHKNIDVLAPLPEDMVVFLKSHPVWSLCRDLLAAYLSEGRSV